MSDKIYYSEEGLEKLKVEIHHLKTVERTSITKQIAEAREKGDLSENAEYDAAKEAQGMLEMKIAKLEEKLANARIIEKSQMEGDKVLILSTVKLKQKSTGRQMTYTLVAEDETDVKSGKISVNSPIGKGLLGKSKGDMVDIEVPKGKMTFEILDVS